eukprot:TRINITY_DN20341_c0_g1_i1.p1 TRINITY_DN20341_c0_g1~~TRINITY_DN20341_c0_g1_i1.p1  ORF type:complete len:347 (+),score=36.86 TRINITY_DN20341_c0_g1_i1:78-1043(+)
MSGRLVAHLNEGELTLPSVPISARLSERVHVALGMNPSAFSLQGTNTYLVGTGSKRILIDTGDEDFVSEYIPVLRRAVQEAGATGIEQIVVTHWHRDHIGGVRVTCHHQHKRVVWTGGEGAVSAETALEGCRVTPLLDGEVLKTEGATLHVLHTPGHANDHVALLLEEECAMFTGDNVLGTGTPVFKDLPLYLRSLHRMASARPTRLYTSHGPVVEDGAALIAEYIAHRDARVQQVRAMLSAKKGTWHTAEQITRGIYTQHPEHLIGPATGNTVQALRVLHGEGVVECEVGTGMKAIANPHPSAPQASLSTARWRIPASRL